MSNLEKLQQLNTNTPRETSVYLYENTVVKKSNNLQNQSNWLGKQQHARRIQEFLNAKNNHAYHIPLITELSTQELFVVEQRAFGKPLTADFIQTLSGQDLDIIYHGLAHAINDIISYKPVLTQSIFFDTNEQGNKTGD